MKERIVSFDAFRFILALCVALGHTCSRLYRNGMPVQFAIQDVAVDGFFILSGFLMALSVMSKIGPDTDNDELFISSTKKRFCRLWPEYFFALLLVLTLSVVCLHKYRFNLLPFNLILLSYVNSIPGIMNGSWYIGVLFFGGAVLQYLLICKRKQAVYFWFPLIIFLLLGYIYGHYGHLSLYSRPGVFGVYADGFLKGFMDMSIGIECYFASQYISRTDFHFRPWAKKFLPFVWEILGLFLVLYAWLHKGLNTHNFVVLFGYVILILLLAQKKEFFLRFLSWKSWKYITPTAYMLFLTHIIWLKLVRKYILYQPYPRWLVCLIVIIFCSLFACVWYQLQKWFFARLKKALFLPAENPVKNIQ